MLDVLNGFVVELRAAGLPVSLREAIDAAQAVRELPLADRDALRSALGATLVKSPDHRSVFRSTFEVYFSLAHRVVDAAGEVVAGDEAVRTASPPGTGGEADVRPLGADDLRDLVLSALASGADDVLDVAARLAVGLYGSVEAARPVGVSYYLHRTLRAVDLEGLVALLLSGSAPAGDAAAAIGELRRRTAPLGALGDRLVEQELNENAARLRRLIEADIRRRLIAERGAAAVARSLRRPLLEDVEFMHASADELVAMRRAIYPLARILAARLARRRRHRRRGPLDFRATIRRSLSSGGVPLEPRFKTPHPNRPEIFVLADVSGSVAAFARFTVHLVYAISAQFSKVRSAVFIDGVDEVTDIFRRAASITEAIERVGREADVVEADGHSDYGSALRLFSARYGHEVTSKTNLIILGDARSNYHPGEATLLKELQRRAHRVFWLNPEPEAYWGSGDSIIGDYAPYCDGVFECRTLRQLNAFVDHLA